MPNFYSGELKVGTKLRASTNHKNTAVGDIAVITYILPNTKIWVRYLDHSGRESEYLNRQEILDNFDPIADVASMGREILEQFEQSNTPVSLFLMGMLSDAQQMLSVGRPEVANQILNDAKILVDAKMSLKDEKGRHSDLDLVTVDESMTVIKEIYNQLTVNYDSSPFVLTKNHVDRISDISSRILRKGTHLSSDETEIALLKSELRAYMKLPVSEMASKLVNERHTKLASFGIGIVYPTDHTVKFIE